MPEPAKPPFATTLENPARRRLLTGAAAGGAALALPTLPTLPTQDRSEKLRVRIKNVVVIYLENRSFNNLFAGFPGATPMLSELTPEQYQQRDRNGLLLKTLPRIWGGMVPGAQMLGGTNYQIDENAITGLANAPFALKDAKGKVLPQSVITRDLWHLFYQNQMQINDGKNDGFVAWANSGALPMGYYAQSKTDLNLWQIAQRYTLCDRFFMAAFGGSYLNHQFLISARTPVYPDAQNSPAKKKIAVLDDGATGHRLKVAPDNPASALDGAPIFVNNGAITPDGYAVNTMAPPFQPSYVQPAPGDDPRLADPGDPSVLPPQTYDTIGDLLSAKNISWAWYGGAWQSTLDGAGGPDRPNFQYHHQPFNYFKSFSPGTAMREQHLKDGGLGDSAISNHFIADALAGKLPAVTFYKPQGNLNLHAGYASVDEGDAHVANVLAHLQASPQWKDMAVIITFDENGGWWDPVAPPKGDRWGPGTRIPAIVVSPFAKRCHVDHTFFDTTSIIRFITRLHDLPELEGVKERNAAFAARKAEPPGDLSGLFEV